MRFCRSCSVTIYEFFLFCNIFFCILVLSFKRLLKPLGIFQLKITDITCMPLTDFVGSVFNV